MTVTQGKTLYEVFSGKAPPTQKKRDKRRRRGYLVEYHGDALPRIDPEEWPVERFN